VSAAARRLVCTPTPTQQPGVDATMATLASTLHDPSDSLQALLASTQHVPGSATAADAGTASPGTPDTPGAWQQQAQQQQQQAQPLHVQPTALVRQCSGPCQRPELLSGAKLNELDALQQQHISSSEPHDDERPLLLDLAAAASQGGCGPQSGDEQHAEQQAQQHTSHVTSQQGPHALFDAASDAKGSSQQQEVACLKQEMELLKAHMASSRQEAGLLRAQVQELQQQVGAMQLLLQQALGQQNSAQQ
jgi:hypothetical protein